MFESLKAKMKSLFSRAEKKIDEKAVYKEGPDAPQVEPPKVETPEVPKVETPKVEVPEVRTEVPKVETPEIPKVETPAVEPVKPVEPPKVEVPKVPETPAPKVETPAEPPKKLSRKEQLKLEKQKKSGGEASKLLNNDFLSKRIKEDPLDEILDELEIILLEADVAYPVAEEIKSGVRENLVGKKYDRSYTLEQVVELSVKDAVRDVLKINEFDFDEWLDGREKPTVIMFVGINGTGKTTAIAKLTNRIQKQDKTVVLAACDTFRAGAIEQLGIHADKLGCKIVKQDHGADPAAVAFDAIEHAKSKRKDVVFIDTAGRMQTNNNLIEEMKKIVRVAKPDLKIFVGDSLAGNDAIEQAKVFDNAIGIDAVILTKIDTDAKGGAALSIAHTIGKPIAFVCNGQEYDDIIKFNTDWMIDRMFEE
ncbi:MAG: signal recognition particle-docking protein FtsY [Thermoplasmata archaeon]|jgi:fused signal recognition particle receptor|nr:signal recognition particle-docking protein FtsY [Thermoplasmata archaeon]